MGTHSCYTVAILSNTGRYIYIENQFFVSATDDSDRELGNRIGVALVCLLYAIFCLLHAFSCLLSANLCLLKNSTVSWGFPSWFVYLLSADVCFCSLFLFIHYDLLIDVYVLCARCSVCAVSSETHTLYSTTAVVF
jgi:hypothetical protein